MAHDVNINRPPYSEIWSSTAPILLNDHLTFGNLEYPMLPAIPPEGYPRFNGPREYSEAAAEAGVDVFSLANNHANDQGPLGIISTRKVLHEIGQTRPVYFHGTKDSEEDAFEPLYIEKEGWVIGFISATEFLNSPWGEELVFIIPLYRENKEEEFLLLVEEAAASCDILIVSFHAGREYRLFPDPRVRDFYIKASDRGAHIVWGHHPHVLQPWEFRKKNGTKRVILYSTGNFVSGQTWNLDPSKPDSSRVDTGDSAIFRIQAVQTKRGTHISSVKPIPITNYRDPKKGITVMPFDLLLKETELSEEWRRFYEKRRTITRKRILPLGGRNLLF